MMNKGGFVVQECIFSEREGKATVEKEEAGRRGRRGGGRTRRDRCNKYNVFFTAGGGCIRIRVLFLSSTKRVLQVFPVNTPVDMWGPLPCRFVWSGLVWFGQVLTVSFTEGLGRCCVLV